MVFQPGRSRSKVFLILKVKVHSLTNKRMVFLPVVTLNYIMLVFFRVNNNPCGSPFLVFSNLSQACCDSAIWSRCFHDFANSPLILSWKRDKTLQTLHGNVFFYQGFLSQTLTIHRTAGKERAPCFILFCHFHPLMNIQTFICNFAREMTTTYF